MSERKKREHKSGNESPVREIFLTYPAPTRSLLSKLSSKSKQEHQKHIIGVEKRTQFSFPPFTTPSGAQMTPLIATTESNRDSPSTNRIRQPHNLLASSSMLSPNLFPTPLCSAIITLLILYFMVCLCTTWEGKIVEKNQPAFELGRFHRERDLAALSVATPSAIYCRLNSATHLDSIFSVILSFF